MHLASCDVISCVESWLLFRTSTVFGALHSLKADCGCICFVNVKLYEVNDTLDANE